VTCRIQTIAAQAFAGTAESPVHYAEVQHRAGRRPIRKKLPSPLAILSVQWTMWDISLLTCIVGCIASCSNQIDVSQGLVQQFAFVLCAGTFLSWIALTWVVCDNWNLAKLALGALAIACLGGLAISQVRPEAAETLTASWMLTGPMAVIWAQATTVLVLVSLARLDACYHRRHSSIRVATRPVQPV
jgi:hypothetical protein